MDKRIEKMFLKKKPITTYNVYIYLKKISSGSIILKEVDTFDGSSEIILEKEEDFKKNYYNVKELLKEENYINKSVYYSDALDLDKAVYETFVILYKDDNYELVYDLIKESCMIIPSIHKKEKMVLFDKQYDIEINKNLIRK